MMILVVPAAVGEAQQQTPQMGLILEDQVVLPEEIAVSDGRLVGKDSVLLWNRNAGAVWLLANDRVRRLPYDRYADVLSVAGRAESLEILDGVGAGMFSFSHGVYEGSARLTTGRPLAADRGREGWFVAVANLRGGSLVMLDELGREHVITSIPVRALAQDFGLDVGRDDVWLFSLARRFGLGGRLFRTPVRCLTP